LLPVATSAPNAPTNVATSLVSGLVKVTWTDNAANELSFLVERTTPDPLNASNPDNSKWVQVGSAGAVSGSGQQGSFTDVGSTDSYVTLTDPTFDIATKTLSNNASVAAWVNTTAVNTGAILGTQITSAPIALRWGFLDGAGHIGVGVGTAGGIMSKSAVNDGQ